MTILEPGQIINNTYEVENYIGEGAFAEVYRVKHRFLGRQALKVFKTPGMSIKDIDIYLSEAVILSKIDHPNIVRVFDANVFNLTNNNFGFFTMEYLPGGSLEKLWLSHGYSLMQVNQVVEIIYQVCSGISIAHAENPPIIHRDIKPQNILLGFNQDKLLVKMSDFGLAKKVNPLTLMASARGTIGFKAPETLENPLQDSCSGDVWAIGVTFFLLLTDMMPFGKMGATDWYQKEQYKKPRRLAGQINLNVDKELENILSSALSVNPKERFSNASEMLMEIRKWQKNNQKNIPDNQYSKSTTEYSNEDETKEKNNQADIFVDKALELSLFPSKLNQAVNLMAQAFDLNPKLHIRYDYQVDLWRKGFSG